VASGTSKVVLNPHYVVQSKRRRRMVRYVTSSWLAAQLQHLLTGLLMMLYGEPDQLWIISTRNRIGLQRPVYVVSRLGSLYIANPLSGPNETGVRKNSEKRGFSTSKSLYLRNDM